MLLISFKSSLIVEVWDDDDDLVSQDDMIDIFTFPLSNPLDKFNLSKTLTLQGLRGIGKLTLSYGNMTTFPIPCNSMDSPMPSNSNQGTCT